MHTPAPVYTFIVNNIDYQTIYSQPLPNSIENLILNLNNQAVYVPYINKPLKNGDIFTLYGKRAQFVKDNYIGKSPKILELLAETARIPTLIKKGGDFDLSTMPCQNANSNIYISTIFNYAGFDISFDIDTYYSDGSRAVVELVQDGVAKIPAENYSININNECVSNLTLVDNINSDKFYYTFSKLIER